MNVHHKRIKELFSAIGRATGLLLVAISLASCSGWNVEEQIATARQDFVAFDLLAARDGFAKALDQDPHNTKAAYGYARVLMELNRYEDAIPAFESALKLAPNDPRVREGLLYTLYWGGRFQGRRDWLDRTIEIGKETIRAFPERVSPYESVEGAIRELNDSERWLHILNELAINTEGLSAVLIDQSPVFRIHHLKVRLATAQSSGDTEAATMIEDELREELASAVEADASGASPNPGRRYFLAIGHDLLGDTDAKLSWLSRLDETQEGRRMGARQKYYVHYLDFLKAREAPLEERLAIIERWKQRFKPDWVTGDISFYAEALNQEFPLLADEARRQRDEDGQPNDEILDRIVDAGDNLVRLATMTGTTAEYLRSARTLINLDVRPDEALRFADEAIAALKERRPGLIHASVRKDAIDRTSESWIASFERQRGLALVRLGRDAEAELAFRKAIDIGPRSDRFAALGEFLAGQEEFYQEAYELLVAALAHNAEDERLGSNTRGRIREAAVMVGTHIGIDEEALDMALDAEIAEVADVARRRLVDNRLDRVAPDFSLTDTEGNEWRLTDMLGKVVILNYWATWCGPCLAELPHYRDLVDEYASAADVVFLAITTDASHSEVRAFLQENDYRFTVLFDEGSATDFNISGIPAHFIVGSEGRIQYKTQGFPGAEQYNEEMRARIEALRAREEEPVSSSAAAESRLD